MSDFVLLFLVQSGRASWWRVCYQWGLPRLVYLITFLHHTFRESKLWSPREDKVVNSCQDPETQGSSLTHSGDLPLAGGDLPLAGGGLHLPGGGLHLPGGGLHLPESGEGLLPRLVEHRPHSSLR